MSKLLDLRDIKPGMLIAQTIEILRPVAEGEIVMGQPMSNRRMNKWWCKSGQNEQIYCFDQLSSVCFYKLLDLAVQVKAAGEWE